MISLVFCCFFFCFPACAADLNRGIDLKSVLNPSSDLSGRIKLAKFRLFIYSKLEPKRNKLDRDLYISGKPRV